MKLLTLSQSPTLPSGVAAVFWRQLDDISRNVYAVSSYKCGRHYSVLHVDSDTRVDKVRDALRKYL